MQTNGTDLSYHKNLPIPEKVQRRAATRYTVDEDGCWIVSYRSNIKGYGVLTTRDPDRTTHVWMAHRASWVFHNGPIPMAS